MHVDGEGGDESEAEVVSERPGVGVGAKVPADQRAVDGGVRQHRLGARVEMVDVDRAAVLLQVQTPERKDMLEGDVSSISACVSPVEVFLVPGLERLDFGGFWWFICFDCQQLDGPVVRGHRQVM